MIMSNILQTQPDIPRDSRARSRSPIPRRAHPGDEYDRRGPSRGYSPRRDGGYRDRSPPRRGYYDDDRRGYRSPPRARGPVDDYPPPRGRFEDPYRRDYPPDPYVNGRAPYDRPPPRDYPPRDAPYDYERPPRRYW